MNNGETFNFKTCLLSVILFMILLNQGCGECYKIDCPAYGDSVQFTFVKNGEDIFYGTNAIASIDDLKIISNARGELNHYDFTQRIRVFLDATDEYQFILGSVDTLMINSEVEIVANEDCCDQYELSAVLVDELIVCEEECQILQIDL